jgi:hypothetical protein
MLKIDTVLQSFEGPTREVPGTCIAMLGDVGGCRLRNCWQNPNRVCDTTVVGIATKIGTRHHC